MNHIVSIHQPNFFPWLGYFNKVSRSDAFIILDDAQIPKTGGGWGNRVKMFIAGEARWVTAPIQRNYSGLREIREIIFDERKPWRENLVKTLQANYSKAPFFRETMDLVVPLILNPCPNLSEYNTSAIREILAALAMRSDHLLPASTISVSSTSTERLIDLVKAVNGDTYLCGGGASGYQEDDLFEKQGITLLYQSYTPSAYKQHDRESFVPGLSIIDALMQAGKERTRELIQK